MVTDAGIINVYSVVKYSVEQFAAIWLESFPTKMVSGTIAAIN